MRRLRWLSNLLAPADDPRRAEPDSAGGPDTQALLAELQRSRAELAQLRQQVEGSPLAQELGEEADRLAAAEEALLLAARERQAERALRAARLYAAEAQIRVDR